VDIANAYGWHTPFEHVPPAHECPHAAQLLASDPARAMHEVPPHVDCPDGHAQAEFVQTLPPLHA
jgi:hypothetical protein